ncbi:MAG: endonuclease/exonuclease/phosphatase family protein [Ignavibacteriales bacterium]|nr:endonuclease/exonuclease/phosphatase family protein [Ignavibacteriales bacterium]
MKRYMQIISLILFFVITFCTGTYSQTVRVMTFNIRLDSPGDGENIWAKRRANLVSVITYHKADLVGLQEAQKHQLDYIMQSLPDYGYFGVGRDDGKESGEFMAILFRKNRFDTSGTSTFWCSENPDKPGKGWDAAFKRVTTYGKFFDKLTKKTFYMFNTHLDNEGVVARLESAKLIKQKMSAICKDFPVILTGDFNTTPQSAPYQHIIYTGNEAIPLRMQDARTISKRKPYGPSGTFTGFDMLARPMAPIDFIFVKEGVSVLSHAVLSDSFDGFLPSDHYPVLAEVVF